MTRSTTYRLVELLDALPERELGALIHRIGLAVDPAKRIGPSTQLARTLVALPELRDTSRLPPPSAELLHRIAEARGVLCVPTLPQALEPLHSRGIVFARAVDAGVELILPVAHYLLLRPWEGEDPRGIRALLAQAGQETLTAIASHYLKKPAHPPAALAIEAAWPVLGDGHGIARELESIPQAERRVLEGVVRQGGEVDTEELLDLEREPLRLRTAMGTAPSRRGIGFALEKRGLLVPLYPNRHIVPTEVMSILAAEENAEREARRRQVRLFVTEGDHAPRRARFAVDPSFLAMGLALAVREPTSEVRAGVGTPRSLISRLASRFGRDVSHVALVAALSRALGLWDALAISSVTPPGNLEVGDLLSHLFQIWRQGGAWDEARTDGEVLRLAPDARDSSPAGVVRELVLDALRELGEGRWIPWTSLAGYLATDTRIPGVARLLRRWADRAFVEPIDPLEIARRIVEESLPALGLLDVGEDEGDEDDPDAGPQIVLRVTPRGRALLGGPRADGPHSSPNSQASRFLESNLLRIAPSVRVAAVLSMAPFVEVARAADVLEVVVGPQTLSRALSAGVESDFVRSRLETLAPIPEALARTLAQASVIVGRATFVAVSGFLWVDDPSVRELLRTRRATADLFVDPSPPSGLLLNPQVDVDRVARRCRTVGVEVVLDGKVVRARSLPPPPSRAKTKSAR